LRPSAAAVPEDAASAPTFRDVYVEAFTDGFAAELEALRKARAEHALCSETPCCALVQVQTHHHISTA